MRVIGLINDRSLLLGNLSDFLGDVRLELQVSLELLRIHLVHIGLQLGLVSGAQIFDMLFNLHLLTIFQIF